MNHRKAELAEMQLDEAIRQFLDNENFVCAATLAGAAEAIFGSLLIRMKIPTAIDLLYEGWQSDELPSIDRKDFAALLNVTKNQLKHAGDPAFDEMKIGKTDPMLLIARAAGMHPHFASEPTAELRRFKDWWAANAEALINELPDPGAGREPL